MAFLSLVNTQCPGIIKLLSLLPLHTHYEFVPESITTDLPLQGKVQTYQFQLSFAILIPPCAHGYIIRKLPIT